MRQTMEQGSGKVAVNPGEGVDAWTNPAEKRARVSDFVPKMHGSGADYTLVIGGAGFIGSNLAHRLLSQGKRVLIFDSLARPGVEQNLQWLRAQHGQRLLVQIADLRDPTALAPAVCRATAVFHLGAQVAVTTSLTDPLHDFAVNAQGTLHLLETLRTQGKKIPLVFTSTNKVYGALDDLALEATDTCYQPVHESLQKSGISERRILAFHSPYGCSKGAADQYVLDYAHTFGLPAVVFRMSCIYGPRQFGTEDQGWVAHFLRRALTGQPITIYGDGKQVRDLLFVDDLVNAFLLAQNHIHKTAGEAFNLGGGSCNAISLLQLLNLIAELQGTPPIYTFAQWRPGDQRYYVSDTSKFQQMTGWRPQVDVQEGLSRLYDWVAALESGAPINGGNRVTLNGTARRRTQGEGVYAYPSSNSASSLERQTGAAMHKMPEGTVYANGN